jgi:hypothetical protein
MNARPMALLLALIAWSVAGDAGAWIFHEHWRITERAVEELSGPDHATFMAMWAELRAGEHGLLCPDAVRVETSRGRTPDCITFSMLPAIAGDHSCSATELVGFVDDADWLLRVVRLGADTEERLERATNERQRVDAWNAMHLAMERADAEYTSRAVSNDGHFPMPRRFVDLKAYLDDALAPTQPVSSASLYALYHLAAVAEARAYSRTAAGTKERADLALTALAEEAFALHFLQDTFSAGHVVGAWGDNATKKGTHDLYSMEGLVAHSLQEVLGAARGLGAVAVDESHADVLARVRGYDVCRAVTVDLPMTESWITDHVAPVWIDTPMPSSPRGATPPVRQRAELGPFVAFQSGGSFYSMFGGYQSPEAGAARAAFSLGASVGFGYGIEGITTSGGDGRFFLTAGVEAQSTQFDDFCRDCVDGRPPGSDVPRVPSRVGYRFRVRMPFWLVPGDLLVLAPVMYFVARRDLTKMGIRAADGGLIPWQQVIPSAIGDFQFMLGRELAVTFFDMDHSARYSAFAGSDAAGRPIYNPTHVRSIQLEVPVLEYRPFRSFSEKLGSSLALQFGGGIEIPTSVEPSRTDLPAPRLDDVWLLYLRLFFDGRAYL